MRYLAIYCNKIVYLHHQSFNHDTKIEKRLIG
nr:MAG TPA: hypothetical protein [Caudoviricetes sp.]